MALGPGAAQATPADPDGAMRHRFAGSMIDYYPLGGLNPIANMMVGLRF